MASKIGPELESHPKIRHAWSLHHSSLGLHLLGLSFAQQTGGFVSASFVIEKMPAKRERTSALEALTTVAPGQEHPMWSPVDGGWRIHNFARHAEFRTEEQEEQLRRARSAAGRKGAAATWQTEGEPEGNLPSGPTPFATGSSEICHPRQGVNKEKEGTDPRQDVLSLSKMLADGILANDPKARVDPRSKRWLDAARLLIDQDERPIPEIERVIAWCQADAFWRSNILSMPKLREKYSQLLLRMNRPDVRAADTARSARRLEWLAEGAA